MRKHASFLPAALLALPVLSLALLAPSAARASDTVLDRKGGWMLVQGDAPGAKTLCLADASGGSRTLLSTVALPSSTATNVYWDAYAARDPETDTYVPALVTNVSPVGADYEFRAFLNGGHAYWEDSDGGNRRLWSVSCDDPSEKCMLAFWDKSQAPLEPCDPSEAPPSSFFFAMPMGGGVVWEQPVPDAGGVGEIHAATGTVAAVIATNSYAPAGEADAANGVNHARAKAVRAARAAAKGGTATVQFSPWGGTYDLETRVYSVGQKYGSLPVATSTWGAFLGWFTHPTYGELVTAQSLAEEPVWDPAWSITTWGSSYGPDPEEQPPMGDGTWILYAHWESTNDPLPVWRFYSEATKGHFYTIGEAEKTQLLTSSLTWKFQEKAYRAFKTRAEGTVPLYRFYSEKNKSHFFTISETEKANLIKTSKTWKYQGVAYYVFPKAVDGTVPVYRLWSDATQHHFFTASESEKNAFVKKAWKSQGIAFWAFPKSMPVWRSVDFDATGGTVTEMPSSLNGWSWEDEAWASYPFGKPYGAMPVVSWREHAFLGWFTKATGGTRITPPIMVAGTTTYENLYAHWEAAPETEPLKVWRFYSEKNRGHFFTISEAEKTKLLTSSPTWSFQGGAYRAFKTKVAGTVPLYRFYSESYKGHFFTRSEAEKDSLVKTSKTWKFQGIAYYVYPKAVGGSIPVYRFWSESYRHHFYTANESEKDSLVKTSKTWKYQGIAFWALPIGFKPGPKTLTVHDKSAANWLVPVAGAYCGSYQKCEMVYPAAELGAMNGTTITGMTFYASQTNIAWGGTCRVFLKEVGSKTINAYSGPGTVVYEGALRIANKKMVVQFTTPYTYNGGNLLVGIYRTQKGSGTSSQWVGEQVTGASISGYNSSSLSSVTAAQRSFLPKVTFAYELPIAKSAAKARAAKQESKDGAAAVRLPLARPEAEVTTSDGTDGSAAADGDEGTAWAPERPEAGSWLVLTFAEPLEVDEVTVVGENLPEDTRVLLSEDAETWYEGEGGPAQYVWVAFPPVAEVLKVREVWVSENRE